MTGRKKRTRGEKKFRPKKHSDRPPHKLDKRRPCPETTTYMQEKAWGKKTSGTEVGKGTEAGATPWGPAEKKS